MLVGASRKTFLGRLLADADGTVRPAELRDDATLATTVLAAQAGAWGVRVHDAGASVDAVRTVEAVRERPPWLAPTRPPPRPHRAARACAPTPTTASTPSSGERGQMFRVDAVLEVDTAAAAVGDDLDKTVNYAELAQQLYAVLAGEPVNLLETLAQRLADVCLADPLVDAVEITVHKPQAELGVPFDDVTVAIRRERA